MRFFIIISIFFWYTVYSNVNNSSSIRRDIGVVSLSHGGRTGHQIKDIATSIIIATIQGWSIAKPIGFSIAENLIHISKLYDIQHCETNWVKVKLNKTTFVGVKNYSEYTGLLRQLLPPAVEERGKICVIVSKSYRIQVMQLIEWESYGLVPHGSYERVISRLRQALRVSLRKPLKDNSTVMKSSARIVIHHRRGDLAYKMKKTLPLYLKFMSFLVNQYLNHSMIDFLVITEEKNSDDVKKYGCHFNYSYVTIHQKKINCKIRFNGQLLNDFKDMMNADYFIIGGSSISHWAAILGYQKIIFAPAQVREINQVVPSSLAYVRKFSTVFRCIDVVNDSVVVSSRFYHRIGYRNRSEIVCTKDQANLYID
jgi:hypothetical protein